MSKDKYTIEYIKENKLLLLEVIAGSHAYNTAIETSDEDRRGIFVAELDDVLLGEYPDVIESTVKKQVKDVFEEFKEKSENQENRDEMQEALHNLLKEQCSDVGYKNVIVDKLPIENKEGVSVVSDDGIEPIQTFLRKKDDYSYFEIRKYMDMLTSNNPTVLELLNMPDDCVLFKSELLDQINAKDFLSKRCKDSFGGYAKKQISKARGQNKMIVNEMPKARKTPLDFCYAIEGHKTIPLKKVLEHYGYDQKFCGIVSIPNAKDNFALFYDWSAHNMFSEMVPEEDRKERKKIAKDAGEFMGLGYKGIMHETSNSLRSSSVPKSEESVAIFVYSKDAYTQHCKSHKKYWDWVEERNPERYKDSAKKGYDTKNMMHCYRLLQMSLEIAEGKGVNVRRDNREELLAIRKGAQDYDTILSGAEDLMKQSDKAYAISDLPKDSDPKKGKEILLNIRKEFYSV